MTEKLSQIPVSIIIKCIAYEKQRIREHLYLTDKIKLLYLRLIPSGKTLYHITVLVFHRPATVEKGHTVFGIIIQIIGSQRITIPIHQFYQMPTKLGCVLRYHITETVTGKDCVLLLYPDRTYSIYVLVIHIPVRAVALQIRIIVKKHGITHNLTVGLSVHLHQTGLVRRKQKHQTVPAFLAVCHCQAQSQKKRQIQNPSHFTHPSR